MVAHVFHDVTYRYRLVGLDPKGEVVDLAHIPVNVREILIHLGGIGVVAEETPHTGLAVAYGAEIHRAVGLAEAEVGVRALIISLLLGEGNGVSAVHAVSAISHIEAELLVDLLGLWEFLDTAGVGIGADAVVRNSHRDPDGSLVALTLSDYLHDPGLILIADGERLTSAAVAIFLDQFVDAGDCLTGGGYSL